MYNFRFDFGFTPISDQFISQTMLSANGGYVKVYLYAMYLAKNNFDEDTGVIASKLGLLESDVINAFDYWQKEGALERTDHTILFYSPADTASNSVKTIKATPAPSSEEPIGEKKSSDEAVAAMSKDTALSDLCLIAQDILGKTLKKSEIQTLYWFYDQLGLSPEVISMLLEYCAGKNKRNMSYIEKVAISWHKDGVTTIEAVDSYMKAESEKNSYMYSLRKLFGLTDRQFSKTEEAFLEKWKNSYQMNEDMVALAYEYCIMQTSKLSFPYMNAIIERWFQKNIHSIPQAEEDREGHKTKSIQNTQAANKKSQGVYNADSFDYDKLDQIMDKRLNNE